MKGRYALLAAALGAILVFPLPLCATEQVQDTSGVVEEIVVTGSRIKRDDYRSISPLATVEEEAFKLSGTTNVEDLLNDMPQVVPSFDRAANNPGTGAAWIDLRGFGPGRTLVLLNGRRFAPSSVFGPVDVNQIPAALIERVEIVTGGASAVYGSDAVSGAVNFILKQEFDGLEMSAHHDVYAKGDGATSDYDITYGTGFAEGNGRVMVFLGRQDREPVYSGDRAISRVPYIDDSHTGELRKGGSPIFPNGAGGYPTAVLPGYGESDWFLFEADGTARPVDWPAESYNFAGPNYMQIPLDRTAAGLFGSWQFTDSLRAFWEYGHAAIETTLQLAPAPFFEWLRMNIDNPLLTPYQHDLLASNYDRGDGIAEFYFEKRLSELGPRRLRLATDSWRGLFGLDGVIADRWEWEAWISRSRTDATNHDANGASFTRVQQGLLADPATGECFDPTGGCVPINLFGPNTLTPEAVKFIRAREVFTRSILQEDIVGAQITGHLRDLPAGRWSIAAGLEWREQRGEYSASPELLADDLLGYVADQDILGEFRVRELYGETVLPLLADKRLARYLGLEAGIRYSRYSTAGGVWTWKFGIDWQMTDWLRWRTVRQVAVRAPNVSELYSEPARTEDASGFGGGDPCSADEDPVGKGYTELCVAQGIPADQVGSYVAAQYFPAVALDWGGNKDLDVEKARTFTVGFIVQPVLLNSLSITVDYYRIEIDNAIDPVGDPIGLCFDIGQPNGKYCQLIKRAPSGDITEVSSPYINKVVLTAAGYDLAVAYDYALPSSFDFLGEAAMLHVGLNATYVKENGAQQDPLSKFEDDTGYFVNPRVRANASLGYATERLSVSLDWHWIDAVENKDLHDDPTTLTAVPRVDAQDYLDIGFSFTLSNAVEIDGGVSNVLNNDPPMLSVSHGTQINTDPGWYDPFGRRYFLGVTWKRQ